MQKNSRIELSRSGRSSIPVGVARTVAVRGEIDMVTAPALAAKLTEEFRHGSHVVVDLSGVTFFGVSGLVTLLEAGEAAERRDNVLVLGACSPAVLRILKLTHPLGMFVHGAMGRKAWSEQAVTTGSRHSRSWKEFAP